MSNQTRNKQMRRRECQKDGADLEPDHGRAGTGRAGQYGQGNRERSDCTVDPLAGVRSRSTNDGDGNDDSGQSHIVNAGQPLLKHDSARVFADGLEPTSTLTRPNRVGDSPKGYKCSGKGGKRDRHQVVVGDRGGVATQGRMSVVPPPPIHPANRDTPSHGLRAWAYNLELR